MDYNLSLITPEKLHETIELCVKCFGEDWRKIAEVDFPETIGTYPYKPNAILALNGDKVIGMSVVSPVFLTPDTYSITWLCVGEEYRRNGIATALIQKSEEFILENLLQFDSAMVMLASAVDSKYYERLGYQKKCITHRDNPFMVKYIKPLNNPIGIV